MKTLLSPIDIARPAASFPTEETEYDHASQTRFGASSGELIRSMATTFNATQTFDSHGKPKDSDNDK